ncbi:MAG: DUF4430 domain-containing protein [Saccharofermentanales bacterium]
MHRLRYLIGILLSFSLLAGLAGCSCGSAESANLEKKSAVVSEDLKQDIIEPEPTPAQKSDNQIKQTENLKSDNELKNNSEQTAETEKISEQSNEQNENLQVEASSDSADSKQTGTAGEDKENSSSPSTLIENPAANPENTIAVTHSSSSDATLKESSSDAEPAKQPTTSNDLTSSSRTSATQKATSGQTETAAETRTTPAATTSAVTTSGATTPRATTTPIATTTPAITTEAVPDTIRVQISVECINAYQAGNEIAQAISSDGWILGGTIYEMPKNSTVYDLLMATGLVVGSTSTNLGIYVYSIQSLAEFAVDGNGGWIYTVNGTMPLVGVDSYILQPGDIVQFSYTVNLGDL